MTTTTEQIAELERVARGAIDAMLEPTGVDSAARQKNRTRDATVAASAVHSLALLGVAAASVTDTLLLDGAGDESGEEGASSAAPAS